MGLARGFWAGCAAMDCSAGQHREYQLPSGAALCSAQALQDAEVSARGAALAHAVGFEAAMLQTEKASLADP